ncbi:MAG: carbohydrate-binding domain-containing protein [Phycisphaerae bacterium]|nr:carbohydrate-binding domain-containing protein [Phycisphaerae bacterium]
MLTGKAARRAAAMLVVAGLLLLGGSWYSDASGDEPAADTGVAEITTTADPSAQNSPDHEDPDDYVWDISEAVPIALDGTSISASGIGTTVDGNTVTITCGGTYSVSGALADGQIIVDSTDKQTVRLILDGADVHCSWSAPILIENAKKTLLILAENTENYASDGRSETVETESAEEPNAVIFSRDDLTICGDGSLTICGDVNDGISCKDGLIIAGGVIDINVVDDGIRGKDYLVIRGGSITVNARGDGLKADNDEDATLGYISIEGGTVGITSGSDAIQAQTDVLIRDGVITVLAGGGSNTRRATNTEAKGITAGVVLFLDGGDLAVESADDALHSDGSLTLDGGALVLSSMDDAIHADDAVDVNQGEVRITASYEGIECNTVTVRGGDIQIVSSDDGIQAGVSLSIMSGVVKIVSGGDAISSEADLRIAGGEITLTSGGGSSAKIATTLSAKGIKGAGSVVIDDGNLVVNSADDAIHADVDVTINGGTLALSSGDDGIRAGIDLLINGGTIDIAKSYEGLESAKGNITINDGSIHIVSSDDGINVSAGGDTGMGGPGGGPGGWPGGGGNPSTTTAGAYWLYINGGYLAVNAAGDGIDSNGSIAMTDGTVVVSGPTANDNGAIDHLSFSMTGGFLVAAGSSGMAQAPSTTSTQYSILLTFQSTQAANTLVHIQDSQSQDILTFAPSKQYSSVAFSSDGLIRGSSYTVYSGGSSTGTVSDGLYQGGTYTPGAKCATFTVSSMVTNVSATTTGGSTGPKR